MITVEGASGSSTGQVSFAGSLVMEAAIENQDRQSIVLPKTTGFPNGYQLLGGNNIPILGDWANEVRLYTFDSPTAVSYSYTDTSNGGSVLFSGFITGIQMLTANQFALETDSLQAFDLSIEAGDVFSIQGQSSFTLASTFGADFNEGSYSGIYNGQDLMLNVVPVPEPTSFFLAGFGLLVAASTRRRPE